MRKGEREKKNGRQDKKQKMKCHVRRSHTRKSKHRKDKKKTEEIKKQCGMMTLIYKQ